jgi:hypothetical protein
MGVGVGGRASRHNYDLPPHPSPTRGREQTESLLAVIPLRTNML